MSPGVSRSERIGFASIYAVIPTIADIVNMMYAVLEIHCLTLRSFPVPKYCDVTIPPPLPTPLHSAKNRKVTEPVAPTAARASEPTYLPTMIESTKLYNC